MMLQSILPQPQQRNQKERESDQPGTVAKYFTSQPQQRNQKERESDQPGTIWGNYIITPCQPGTMIL